MKVRLEFCGDIEIQMQLLCQQVSTLATCFYCYTDATRTVEITAPMAVHYKICVSKKQLTITQFALHYWLGIDCF